MFREESEGYAKLITELSSRQISNQNVAQTWKNVQSLIGYFDLDPNRVFDIILDAFEHEPENACFLQLLTHFNKNNACQIIGFKFQHYGSLKQGEKAIETPRQLYLVAATLIKHRFFSLKDLYPYLQPFDDVVLKPQVDEYMEKQTREARVAGGVISLNVSRLHSKDVTNTFSSCTLGC